MLCLCAPRHGRARPRVGPSASGTHDSPSVRPPGEAASAHTHARLTLRGTARTCAARARPHARNIDQPLNAMISASSSKLISSNPSHRCGGAMQSACSYSIRTTAGVKKSSTLVLSSSRADSDETPPADLKELVASPTNLWELRASDTASMSSTTESMASRSSPRAVSSALHAHDRMGATSDPVQSSLSEEDDWLAPARAAAAEALACCGCGSALHDGAAAVSPVVSRFCSEARGAFTRLELGITGTRSASEAQVVEGGPSFRSASEL